MALTRTLFRNGDGRANLAYYPLRFGRGLQGDFLLI